MSDEIRIPYEVFDDASGFSSRDKQYQVIARWMRDSLMNVHGRHCYKCSIGELCHQLEEMRDSSSNPS